jgi:leucyl aminopeptidase
VAHRAIGTGRAALKAQGLRPVGYANAVVPGIGEDDWSVVTVVADANDLSSWCLARVAETLPAGCYRLASGHAGKAMLGWVTAQYDFARYRSAADVTGPRVLLTSEVAAIADATAQARATALVRDLVNTPASDMGPAEIETAARMIADAGGASVTVTRGDALDTGYPLIAAVGAAATPDRAPRLIEVEWGDPAHPRVAIVGKGVSFDTGGLDIKTAGSMRLMKKDMGGAAHALGLAQLVIAARLPVRLHLLIPAVENAVGAPAMRPGDVFTSRAGKSVEIASTDAKGRLILADALTKAAEGTPALIVDFATLTGAARVALGPDLPALFANDDVTADAALAAGLATDDALWRLPLHKGYDELLKSDIADLNNAPEGGFAGAVTAALFLQQFVPAGVPWLHLDTFAWRPAAKPGRPKGGEALGMRAIFAMLKERFAR